MYLQTDSTAAASATALMAQLHQVSDWLNSPNLADAWTRPQGEKWTIEQEFRHLLRATYGIVQLFGEPGRALWRPTDRPSRSYDELASEYREKLKLLPPGINANVAAADPQPFDAQKTAWHQTVTAIEQLLPTLTGDDLTQNTVWKHPLLGPVSGLEMLYFSTYHTERHLASLNAKR